MTERQRARTPATTIRIAGAVIAAGALALAAPAGADPGVTDPPPGPSATPVPGQPVVETLAEAPAPPAAPPVGAPQVPEIQNPVYGQGQTPGQLGYLRDIWHAFHTGDPVGALTSQGGGTPAPPQGAGPPPPTPPGFVSLNDPNASAGPLPGADGTGKNYHGGPPLPPGYYPLDGPPPPDYYGPPAPDPAAPVQPTP